MRGAVLGGPAAKEKSPATLINAMHGGVKCATDSEIHSLFVRDSRDRYTRIRRVDRKVKRSMPMIR